MISIFNKKNPVCWVPTVYFAMGLPFVALSMVSVLLFSDFGISNTQIAFWTSLIMLPWTFKMLWSPLLEIYRTKKFFVVATQLITGLLFALVALSLPLPHFFGYTIALMGVMALSGATHDIAGDGIYLTELNAQQQAKYIGWQGAFYNLAKILTNGGLVYLAGYLKQSVGVVQAWMIIVFICSAIMILISIYHLRVLPSGGATAQKAGSVKDGLQTLWTVIVSFFQKKHIAWYIGLIVLYRFAEGFAMKIVPLFLKASVASGGLGLDVKTIGLLYGTFGAAAFILGSILAGYYISAGGLRRTLFSLCCIFNIPFVVYLLLALYQPSNLWLIGSAVVFEYFGYGFGFVGLMLFMMQQVSPGKHQMAHYAFASGIMNFGVMLPGMLSGLLSDWMGYKFFFAWVLIAALPAFFATHFVPFTYPDESKK
jgi:MFS transporter, PAT family, beta-lactamase induction signal transducer AmpG